MDAPAISTLDAEDDEDILKARNRPSKIKLKLPQGGVEYGFQHQQFPVSPSTYQNPYAPPPINVRFKPLTSFEPTAQEEDELDELLDDDLGVPPQRGPVLSTSSSFPQPTASASSSKSTIPSATKKPRAPRGPKQTTPFPGNISALVYPQPAEPTLDGVPQDRMMSAWQADIPGRPNDPTKVAVVWENPSVGTPPPMKPTRRRPPKAPKTSAFVEASEPPVDPIVRPPRRVASRKMEEVGSGTEGTGLIHSKSSMPSQTQSVPTAGTATTPPPHPLSSLRIAGPSRYTQEHHEEPAPNDQLSEIISSGAYKLAPAQPLVIRPFVVQAIPKTSNTYATAPPLDRNPENKPRRWNEVSREVRTIAGGRWIGKTWIGEKESQLLNVEPQTILQPGGSSPASSMNALPLPSGTAKKPNAKQPRGKTVAARRAMERDEQMANGNPIIRNLKLNANMDSSVPATRDPSVDTEMLSLVGDDVGAVGAAEATYPAKRRKMLDSEMDEFLADS